MPSPGQPSSSKRATPTQPAAAGPAPSRVLPGPLHVDAEDRELLLGFNHWNPHRVLGAHPISHNGRRAFVVRAFHPEAVAVECIPEGQPPVALEPIDRGGIFAGLVEIDGANDPAPRADRSRVEVTADAGRHPIGASELRYRLRFHFEGGRVWERDDPYRFLPTLGDVDLHLYNEGTHRRLWEALGARRREIDGVSGTAFSVWAPSARRVSVVGDFCHWDGRLFPMRALGSSGVFELFVPGVEPGAHYKFEIKTQLGDLRMKSDPLAFAMENPPGTCSRVFQSAYRWSDDEWMRRRAARDWRREPLAIYEVHVGSWARVPEEGNRVLTYRELAPRLIAHVRRFGFNAIELLPVAEHPYTPSWGYQISGYYAPTARYGSPDDFRWFVDQCHQAGIAVLVDWVPAHFPKDDFALARFDGTHLYEHGDPRLGEHPDWGTLIFNYGRNEVRSFLISNALYWLRELHVDGLRVDAVASMLYLDYSRRDGEWIPNPYGGNENIEAIDFLRALNDAIHAEAPGCFTVAEESTAWSGVSNDTRYGGLGFTFKWNMGWMHDTLVYMSKEPVHRRWHHGQLSFAMVYEYHERFIMPLSHDEVVHGKGSLLSRMPGDAWQKLANYRLLLTYQFTRPGKKLLFMGSELAPYDEWHFDRSLDWHLASDPERRHLQDYLTALGSLYQSESCLWRRDHDPEGFEWLCHEDHENSVLAFVRRDGDTHLIVVLNFTPVPRDDYRVGAPRAGAYAEVLCSDARSAGGSGYPTRERVSTDPLPWHGREHSLSLRLPPLGAVVLRPV